LDFKLKYQGKTIQKASHPLIKLETKLLHEDGTHKKIPNSLSPFLVTFRVLKSYEDKVFELQILHPKTKKLIYSRDVPIKTKEDKPHLGS